MASRGSTSFRSVTLAIAGVAVLSQRAAAQAPRHPSAAQAVRVPIQQRIESLIAPYVDPAGAPGKAIGLVAGVSSPTARLMLGFGAKTRFGTVAPGPDDIFEIGSITKVFTGFLLARGIERGQVALDASIEPWFPAGSPRFNGTPIALLDLATHTSDLPDFPNNMHSSDPANPAAGYTAQDLADFMSSYVLAVAPGAQFRYSNLGAGTLGHVLVQAAGAANYEALVIQEIADPLGMGDTRVSLSQAQAARRIQGYRNGVPAPFNDIGAPLQGGGALRSTARDLLAFLDPAVRVGPASAAATWRETVSPRRASPFGTNGATGYLVNSEDHAGGRLYTKGGGTAGFTSHVAFVPAQQVSVVLLANCNGVQGLRDLANAIVDLLRDS
jgi:CubicO group peptidase (beta-lactamase class C family)